MESQDYSNEATHRHASHADDRAALQPGDVLQNHLLSSLFEQTAVGVAFLDVDYRLMQANQKFCDLLGYSATELRSLPYPAIIHPDDLEASLSVQPLPAGERSISVHNRYVRRDSSVLWTTTTVTPVYSADAITSYSIIVQDISDRQQAKAALQQNHELKQRVQERTVALQESEEKFRQLGENINKIFCLEDTQGHLLYVSPSYKQIWGQPVEALYQNPNAWLEAVFPEDRDRVIAHLSVSAGSFEGELNYRIIRSDGEVRWISERSFPLYNAQGELYRIAGIAEDITERKQIEQEMRHSRDLFEAIFQESADAVFLVNVATSTIQTCNRRAVQLFEADSQADLIGIQGHTLHKDLFLAEDFNEARSDLATQGHWSQEIEYQTLKGHYFWGNLAAKQIQVAGQPVNLIRITDISDRKRSEQILQQHAERERLLKQAAFNTRASLNLNYILNTTVSCVHQFLECDRVIIYRFEPDGGGTIAIEAVSQPEFSLLGRHLEDPCFNLKMAERYRQGRISAVSDIYSSEIAPCYVEFLATIQVRANLVVPILQEDQLWGLLTAHHCTGPRQWQPFESDLLNQLTVQVGIAIRQTGLYSQLEIELGERRRAEHALEQQVQREQLLRVLSQQIRQSLHLNEILAATVTEVRRVLQADRVVIFRLKPDLTGHVIQESVAAGLPATIDMVFVDEIFPADCYDFYCQGNARVVQDATQDEWGKCLSDFMQQVGVKSKIVAPIIQKTDQGSLQPAGESQDVLWGLIIAHACVHQREWLPVEVNLLQQLATQVGIAIQQADLYTQVENQLWQKEILMKEVHHRVKNNLQVISAMLKLQAHVTQDAAILNVLDDSQSRLRAIALIHEILYQSNNLERLDFKQYIQRLGNTILAAHGTRTRPIHLTYDLQPILINLETAIPCGLLLSELITNAFKHAFPNQQKGEIWITLEQRVNPTSGAPPSDPSISPNALLKSPPPQYVLTVRDNGVGIFTDLDVKNLSSLGLRIAYDLTLQLRGTLELDRTHGTQFKLTFSELDYRKRL